MLLGYPLWPQGFLSYKFSDDGIRGVDCLLLQNPNGCRIPDVCPVALHEVHLCVQGLNHTNKKKILCSKLFNGF